ncbi:hypothetical protein RYH73_25905 [Olivibacter sp. CPCC 100613]|uniref:hypothetical protein n=1 Tax=Olivibacter sp. CPCC 100613 TaxID=3079931 RepID=UPI002FF5DF42
MTIFKDALDLQRILKDLAELTLSTTFFLEKLSGKNLHVCTLSQTEELMGGEIWLLREVVLFFSQQENPVLYCISKLRKSKLTDRAYLDLIEGKTPIGKIFYLLNGQDSIQKKMVKVNKISNEHIQQKLNCFNSPIFEKKYEYWIGNNKLGVIEEYYGLETLSRIYDN